MKIIACILIASGLAMSQTQTEDMVTVPKRYVSAEGLDHAQPATSPETASKWVGFGKEVGQALDSGLGAVVDKADKFGATKVGMFVMFMVAWRVMGDDALALVKSVMFGIPFCLMGVALWVWCMRHFFFAKRVLVKRDGKLKEWEVKQYNFETKEARIAAIAIHAAFIGIWLLIWTCKIF